VSRSQRTKGANGERELVRLLRSLGIDCERTARNGVRGAFDISSAWGSIECKRRKRIGEVYDWVDQASGGIVMCRADRRGWLVIQRLEDYARVRRR